MNVVFHTEILYNTLIVEHTDIIPSILKLVTNPERQTVVAATHGALEALSMALVPAATIGIMAYGFKMMFRGVLKP